jgi:hypothetical protein
MGVALKDLKGRVKRPVRSVRICLDGDLWARHDELTAKLDELGTKNIARMGQATGAAEVAQEMTEVEAAMREAQVTIEFRGICTYEFKQIQAAVPVRRQEHGVGRRCRRTCPRRGLRCRADDRG